MTHMHETNATEEGPTHKRLIQTTHTNDTHDESYKRHPRTTHLKTRTITHIYFIHRKQFQSETPPKRHLLLVDVYCETFSPH